MAYDLSIGRNALSSQRYTPELKGEAVRQVLDRGNPISDVAERLGVSAYSLYDWLKAVKPDNTEQQANEFVKAKCEILKLRAKLRRTEEERNILKRPRGTSIRSPSEVPLHRRLLS